MKYQITSDNIDLSPSMIKLAEEKLAKLESRTSNVRPELKSFRVVMNTAPNETFVVKVESVIHGKKYFAEKTSYTLENSLVQSIEEIDRMLEKEQDKGDAWNKKREQKRFDLPKDEA
jgi:ribosome-associated translation inhibitor RaiA